MDGDLFKVVLRFSELVRDSAREEQDRQNGRRLFCFSHRLAPPLGMGYTTRRKQTAAPGEWPAGKGVFMRVLNS